MTTSSSPSLRQRFHGAVTVLYGLMPAILVLSFLLILLTIVSDIKAMVNGPLNNIQTALTDVKGTANEIGNAVGDIAKPIQDINEGLEDALQAIDSIPKQLDFPSLKIPDVMLPVNPVVSIGPPPKVEMADVPVRIPAIPGFQVEFSGLSQITEVLSDNLKILSSLSSLVANIPGLETVREESAAIASAGYKLAQSLKVVLIQALVLVLLAALVLVPLWVRLYISPYFAWAKKQVKTGVNLWRGASSL